MCGDGIHPLPPDSPVPEMPDDYSQPGQWAVWELHTGAGVLTDTQTSPLLPTTSSHALGESVPLGQNLSDGAARTWLNSTNGPVNQWGFSVHAIHEVKHARCHIHSARWCRCGVLGRGDNLLCYHK